MARDRFVNWEKLSERPAHAQIGALLRHYTHETGFTVQEIVWQGAPHGYTVSLPGYFVMYEESHKRWIEVVVGALSYDVITRAQDDITNDVADGIARLIARRFKGKIEVSDLSNRLLTPAEEKAGVQ